MKNKRPIYQEWQVSRREYDFTNAEAVGLVCGKISDNVEVIDLDLKYDLTGKLYSDYKKAINEIDPTLLKKLVVQKTVSGGYHFIYKCSKIDGNKKLAQRYTTEEEKQETFRKTYERIKSEEEKKPHKDRKKEEEILSMAKSAKENDTVRVLLETRGDKGFVACYPTAGYDLVYGNFDKIQYITPEQRDILFSVAYSFNEVVKEYIPTVRVEKTKIKGLKPFDDYNDRGDVIGLLEKHGWKVVGKKGRKLLMLRPGDTSASHSGNFDEDRNWFSVFSTSTQFEPMHSYYPAAVYAVLECNGDYNEAAKKLYDLGYGDRQETIIENRIEIPSLVSLSDDDFSFLATSEDYDDYLDSWRKGTFEMGKTTGFEELDKHFLFKEGDLVIINGIDNVGKSTVIWYLAMLSNLYHGWQWLIFSSENKTGSIMRKLIEFYWSEPLISMNEVKYKIAKKHIEENISIIKCKDRLYNYQDILNMTTKAMTRKKYRGLMIDPYNSLKVDIPAKSKQQTYDYHYEAASVLQLYGKQNNVSIYLNCHVGTAGARNKGKDNYTMAPQKEDTEMGVMFANKADDFLTIHRITQHPTEWMNTEIHVRKIKETETGGRVTPFYSPVKLRMCKGMAGFESLEKTMPNNGNLMFNPVFNYHLNNAKETQKNIFDQKIDELPLINSNSDEDAPF